MYFFLQKYIFNVADEEQVDEFMELRYRYWLYKVNDNVKVN